MHGQESQDINLCLFVLTEKKLKGLDKPQIVPFKIFPALKKMNYLDEEFNSQIP